MICPVCLEQNDHIEALMAETTTPDDTTRSYYPIGTLIFQWQSEQ